MTLSRRIATVRKALVTLMGIVSALLTANLLPAEWAPYVSTAVGIATIVLTYQVPNAGQVKHEVSVSLDSAAVQGLIDEKVAEFARGVSSSLSTRAVRNVSTQQHNDHAHVAMPQTPGVADHAAPEA